jgi:hypothetical protein
VTNVFTRFADNYLVNSLHAIMSVLPILNSPVRKIA